MTFRILTVRITQQNLASVRDRTRQVGELFGLDKLDCTRFITAVSEIARNTAQYVGEGNLTFLFTRPGVGVRRQALVAQVSDQGPGIQDLRGALAGALNAHGQAAMGLAGAEPLYGTCSSCGAPTDCLNNSPAKCGAVPLPAEA
jgi:anti-sigma regulatory factor (Ser/Thr protein kinase)